MLITRGEGISIFRGRRDFHFFSATSSFTASSRSNNKARFGRDVPFFFSSKMEVQEFGRRHEMFDYSVMVGNKFVGEQVIQHFLR